MSEPPPGFPRAGPARVLLRFALAALVVVVSTAGATATAGLLGVQGFVEDLKAGGTIRGVDRLLARAEAGEPRTLLLIGSDRRDGAGRGDARSDTVMLVRLDPGAAATTVLSIPRDLRATFRDLGGERHVGVKVNEAYALGGARLTARVVARLLDVEVNHVLDVDFRGFREAIDAIGCVYVDVDRRYHHSNAGVPAAEQYDEIDIAPGYRRLCGAGALDYVRYRHGDHDLVRAARQQDFLRQVRSQYGASDLLADPHRLTRIVGRRMRTDPGLQSVDALIEFAKLLAGSADAPVAPVRFPARFTTGGDGAAYVEASPGAIARVRRAFLRPGAGPPGRAAADDRGARGGRGGVGRSVWRTAGLATMAAAGRREALALGRMRFPVYYPRLLGRGDGYMAPVPEGGYPLRYAIRTPDGRRAPAYRLVVSSGELGNYYGVQGTTWRDPPILADPSERRTVNGRRLELHRDGRRLRLVAWRTPRAVYWLSNTLEQTLTNAQMLAIAGSLTRLVRG